MSYESAVVVFTVFLIPAAIFVITSVIRLRQHEKEEQAELDVIFTTRKDGYRKYFL